MRVDRPKIVTTALAALLFGSLGGALYLWRFAPLTTLDQRLGAATAALTAGAVLIAVVAGVVALQAYRDAIRRPRLEVVGEVRRGRFSEVVLSVANDGDSSARNIVVSLEVQATIYSLGEWGRNSFGWLQWEAKAGVVVHPKVSRDLPSILLDTAEGLR